MNCTEWHDTFGIQPRDAVVVKQLRVGARHNYFAVILNDGHGREFYLTSIAVGIFF